MDWVLIEKDFLVDSYSDCLEASILDEKKFLLLKKLKGTYIYKISKEIHKGTKVTSNSLEKLADYCVEHKINKRNDEGCDPRSLLYNSLPLSFFFLSPLHVSSLVSLHAMVFLLAVHDFLYKMIEDVLDQLAQVSCTRLNELVA